MKINPETQIVCSTCCCLHPSCTVRFIYLGGEDNDLYIETGIGGHSFWFRVKQIIRYLFKGGGLSFSECIFDNNQADTMITLFQTIKAKEKMK